jgi:hypothetical protein
MKVLDEIKGVFIDDVIRREDLKSREIEFYINCFVVDNVVKLGRIYSQKELLWYCSKISNKTLRNKWYSSIKKYFGEDFIEDFNPKKYRS